MIDLLLQEIAEKYPLKEKDAGEYAQMKFSGMRFSCSAYEAEGLGHVSVMSAKGFFGLMKLDTVILVPKEIELPLFSYDRILAMGKDTLISELYDTVSVPYDTSALEGVLERYTSLPDRDPGEHWSDAVKLKGSLSKKSSKKESGRMDDLALDYFRTYLSSSEEKTKDPEVCKKKTDEYVLGLLENGGPSTDVFLKNLGREKTEELYRKILFGIG